MTQALEPRLLKRILARMGFEVRRLPRAESRSSPSSLARLTDNVYLQDEGATLFSLLHEVSTQQAAPAFSGQIKFVHVVNPYSAPHRIPEQKLAFESMRQARSCYESKARAAGAGGTVLFVAAAFDEDLGFASTEFEEVVPLQRSALDVGRFQVPRKLPLLPDLVAAGRARATDGDFLIYTNSDICLAPSFYGAVALLLRAGIDAITINRRTIELFSPDTTLLPLMAASMGRRHPGFDCFAFPAHWFDAFVPARTITGVPGVARGLLYNMIARANRMAMLNAVHLTFHIGNDRPWKDPKLADYGQFNLRETQAIYKNLSPEQQERLRSFCHAYREPPMYSGIKR